MQTTDPALTKVRATETTTDRPLDENQTINKHPDNHDEVEENVRENKGTDTFKEGVVHSEHVNDNDNPARQPDRRDQPGNGFDDNINEETVGSESPDSDKINDLNRYANIDNAQTRVLNPDQKNSNR